jgi:dCMP deaminase
VHKHHDQICDDINCPHYQKEIGMKPIDSDEITSPETPAAVEKSLHDKLKEGAEAVAKTGKGKLVSFEEFASPRQLDHKWDLRFMALARHISEWSKDPSTKVGAVIVNWQRQIVGLGYNGFPRGVHDDAERYAEKSVKYSLIVHSEANAILNANVTLLETTIYTTKYPCSACTKLIIQSGMKRVVCPVPSSTEPWASDASFSGQMLTEAGLEVTYIP